MALDDLLLDADEHGDHLFEPLWVPLHNRIKQTDCRRDDCRIGVTERSFHGTKYGFVVGNCVIEHPEMAKEHHRLQDWERE